MAGIVRADSLLLEDIGFDEAAIVGVVGVFIVAEDGKLLEALFRSALTDVDLAEGKGMIGGREGTVTIDIGSVRLGNVSENPPAVIAQCARERLDQALEILAVGRKGQTRRGDQADQPDGQGQHESGSLGLHQITSCREPVAAPTFSHSRLDGSAATNPERTLDRTIYIIHYVRSPNKDFFK